MPKRTQACGPKGLPNEREFSASGASLESVPPKARRRFSASERLRILKAADAAVASGVRGAIAELLRKEGIYSSHLAAWRVQFGARGAEGLTAQKPGRKPKLDEKDRQLLAVVNELAQVKHKLQVAHALIDLQKKAREMLGIAFPDFGEAN